MIRRRAVAVGVDGSARQVSRRRLCNLRRAHTRHPGANYHYCKPTYRPLQRHSPSRCQSSLLQAYLPPTATTLAIPVPIITTASLPTAHCNDTRHPGANYHYCKPTYRPLQRHSPSRCQLSQATSTDSTPSKPVADVTSNYT